ncbi:MAG: hypothetical protein ACREO8_04515 [Luteimonas sp.]
MRVARLRFRLVLRLGALLLFAAGALLQPALASMGALHELAEHAANLHADASEHVTSADRQPATDDAAGVPDPLHVLLHYAHCCGPSGALFAVMPSVAQSHACTDAPRIGESATVRRAYLRGPFRPPISA